MDSVERVKYHWYDIMIDGDQFHQRYQSLAHALTDTALMKLDETDVVSVKRAEA